MQKKFVASAVVSELQSSDMYLSIRACLCDTKKNLNNVRVTEAFIDEIVENKEKYCGIPLCADVRGLINDKNIGHMYNRSSGEFKSAIIGSIQDFEKEPIPGGARLIITARVMKRYTAVCAALARLFSEGRLKFSFEICCGNYETLEDNSFLIDADPSNYLEGAAIVSFPACEDAVAVELVAECLSKGDEDMADENPVVVTSEEEVIQEEAVEETATEEVIASESTEDVAAESKEEAIAESEETVAESEENSSEETEIVSEETVTAAVVIHETHEESNTIHAFDTETGQEVYEKHCDEVSTTKVLEDATLEIIDDTSPGPMNAEKKDNDEDEKCGEEKPEDTLIAELKRSIEELRSELAMVKNMISPHTEVSETNEVVAEEPAKWTLLNPFVDDSMRIKKNKYRLLEEEDG